MDLQAIGSEKPGARLRPCCPIPSNYPHSTITQPSRRARQIGLGIHLPRDNPRRPTPRPAVDKHSSGQSTLDLDGETGSLAGSRLRVRNVGNDCALWEKGHDRSGSGLVT